MYMAVDVVEECLDIAVDVSFNVEDTFDSFYAIITKGKAYEQAKFVQFWKCAKKYPGGGGA